MRCDKRYAGWRVSSPGGRVECRCWDVGTKRREDDAMPVDAPKWSVAESKQSESNCLISCICLGEVIEEKKRPGIACSLDYDCIDKFEGGGNDRRGIATAGVERKSQSGVCTDALTSPMMRELDKMLESRSHYPRESQASRPGSLPSGRTFLFSS